MDSGEPGIGFPSISCPRTSRSCWRRPPVRNGASGNADFGNAQELRGALNREMRDFARKTI